jgi:hypothetical protein
VHNGGCSSVLTCLAERSQSPKYMTSWLSERFWRPVHVFRKGLRAAVVMEHAGCHHYLFTGASQMGRRLVPRSLS